MAQPSNPFETLAAKDTPEAADHRALLSQTRPWLLVFGILTGGSALLLVGLALIMGLIGGAGFAGSVFGAEAEAAGLMGGGAIMAFISFFYLLIGGFYGFLAYLLIKQANAIGRFAKLGGLDVLGDVLRAHRDFWRVSGISVLVLMVLYCGGIGLAGVLGAVGGALAE